MTLSINLIDDTEKRPGGSGLALFILKAISGAFVVAVLLFAIHQRLALRQETVTLERNEDLILQNKARLADLQERELGGLAITNGVQEKLYRQWLSQLEGWNRLRITWSRELGLIRQVAPSEIQITQIHLTHNRVFSNNAPVFVETLTIKGRTGGAQPEDNVLRFQSELQTSSLTGSVAAIQVPEGSFVKDSSSDALPLMDHLFQMDCLLKPRAFP